MSDHDIRSVVTIDIGATNAKAVQFAPDLTEIAARSTPVILHDGPPYKSIDAGAALDFAVEAIRAMDAETPVDAIIPCAHGSALALLDEGGGLALPVMSYMADMPADIATAYADIAPPFEEALAPVNPGALTLGRQLLWQEAHFPEVFLQVRTILPYAQYIACRLSGVAASEASALGAQTHLWAPMRGDFSTLARGRGWAGLFAPLRSAAEALGPARIAGLRGRGVVHVGLHDSNANFHRYGELGPLALLSTGTWIIAFDSEAPLDKLDGARDQVSNTTVTGAPVACARFMGGEEYGLIAGGGAPDLETAATLVGRGAMALPSFTDSGGPVPGSGGAGRIVGDVATAERASLAALYTAQMTALMLDRLGGAGRVVVDGPFGGNAVYLSLLAALIPGRAVLRSGETNGVAAGAAMLCLPDAPPPVLFPVAPAEVRGLSAYQRDWLRRVEALTV